MQEYEQQYLSNHVGNMSVVFLESDINREKVMEKIEKCKGIKLEYVDSFGLDIGNSYLVYKIVKE